jgi:DNA-directed RNA polymerase subunit RPC12/RpoP
MPLSSYGFCSKCHKKVLLPKNIVIGEGNIVGDLRIKCPYCKDGFAKFSGKSLKKEEGK